MQRISWLAFVALSLARRCGCRRRIAFRLQVCTHRSRTVFQGRFESARVLTHEARSGSETSFEFASLTQSGALSSGPVERLGMMQAPILAAGPNGKEFQLILFPVMERTGPEVLSIEPSESVLLQLLHISRQTWRRNDVR